MTMPVGGQRLRLIKQNVRRVVNQALIDLDYMSDDWRWKPVAVTGEPYDAQIEILPNKVHISAEDIVGLEAELGSGLMENRWTCYVDIFAQNDSIGMQLAGDIRDILRGKNSAIGRTRPTVNVLDYRGATPSLDYLFYIDIQDVDMTKAQTYSNQFNKNWWVVACVLVDYYNDDLDDAQENDEGGDFDGGDAGSGGGELDGGGA